MTRRAYAPGRVNLIGEHTDYNLGYALPIALQVGTTVEYDPGPGDLVASSADEPDVAMIPTDTVPGGVTGWGAYVAGCLWVLRDAGHPVGGGRVRVASDVPVGAGLSSSAALECAALLALVPDVDDRHAVARLAQRAENEYVGAPTGLLDQLASLYGAPDTALLIDFLTLDVRPVPVPSGDGVHVLIIDSRAPHRHAAGEYRQRREACEAAAAELGADSLRAVGDVLGVDSWRRLSDDVVRRRARHILTENVRVLEAADALRGSDFEKLGALMSDSHASMRDDFEITIPSIDRIASAAVDLGAYGARMTGGGFGGSVVAFAPAGATERIEAELPGIIESLGHPRPTVRRVSAGRGAQRLI
ncbi:galactokinase [Tsukamurella sp. 8F]|uniref:galactokinase n=1 Tax=unclassified Tsukamurella TaxID=2633480 RepID=UPI0023BA33D9|nr:MULTISPECIES: galactokinase [unclassified Tsukamurella]MDF0531058.1 galactokinase [Tsukamurella sp. 8J]MDF0585475.1 galactokinase [Tsukamurella sp. 8F]